MPWVAISEKDDDPNWNWAVVYEAADCNGAISTLKWIGDGLAEQEARTIAQRLNG